MVNMKNLSSLQNLWRDDENIWRSLGDKNYLQALPRLYNQKAIETYKENQIKRNPKLSKDDIKISCDKNGEAHLYLHFNEGVKDYQYYIRYSREAVYLKNKDVMFFVDKRNSDKYRKSDLICFVEKNGTDRYVLDSKCVDYMINNNNIILLSDAKKLNLYKAHWYECGNETFELEVNDCKTKKRIYRSSKKPNQNNTLTKFDITKVAGHRDTSRLIKVYSINTKTLMKIKSLTSLYKVAKENTNINKTERQFINAGCSAASSSIQKIKNFKEDGTLPRTKTSFLRIGYIFLMKVYQMKI